MGNLESFTVCQSMLVFALLFFAGAWRERALNAEAKLRQLEEAEDLLGRRADEV